MERLEVVWLYDIREIGDLEELGDWRKRISCELSFSQFQKEIMRFALSKAVE